MIITNSSPNNIVQLKNGDIIQINQIFSLQNNGLNKEKIQLKGFLYHDKNNVFKYPYKSSNVGL